MNNTSSRCGTAAAGLVSEVACGMKSFCCRIVFAGLLAAALVGCNGDSTNIGYQIAFAWYDSRDYTNLYHGGDPSVGGVPIIPGGCDYAKWNERYVLTKGEHWRYANWPGKFDIPPVPADGYHYFVLDKKAYQGRQNEDPALYGPLTQEELAKWERRIPGPFQEP
jgi:hypothetical protein